MSDTVNHPSHYNSHPSGIECLTIVRHYNFNLGNVIKYIWRAGKKSQEGLLKDLKKAQFYLNDEIEKLENESGVKGLCESSSNQIEIKWKCENCLLPDNNENVDYCIRCGSKKGWTRPVVNK